MSRHLSAALAVISMAALTSCSGSTGTEDSPQASASSYSESNSSQVAPSTSTQPSSAPAPTPKPGAPGSVTIAASGDLIAHPKLIQTARKPGGGYNFYPLLAPLAPFLSTADVRICQMENPLSETNTNLPTDAGDFPSFNAPHELAAAVKALGFQGCSTANNHAFDRGLNGVASTKRVMAASGLKAAGPNADPHDTTVQPVFYEAKGFKIAQLSYSYTLDNKVGNETDPPANAPWMAPYLYMNRTPEGIEQDAAAARKQGADIVVVSMHWGIEYKLAPSDEQKRIAAQLLKSGQVDWIIGNHPHVVEPCQKIDGRYVNYSLGNTMTAQRPKFFLDTRGVHVDDGALASVTFTRDDEGKITQKMAYQPINQPYEDHVSRPAGPAWNPQAAARITSVMTSMGCDAIAAQ